MPTAQVDVYLYGADSALVDGQRPDAFTVVFTPTVLRGTSVGPPSVARAGSVLVPFPSVNSPGVLYPNAAVYPSTLQFPQG